MLQPFIRLFTLTSFALFAGFAAQSAAAQAPCSVPPSDPGYWLPAVCPVPTARLLHIPETPPQPAPFGQHRARYLARDRWWAVDKAKHAAASFLLTLSSQYVLTEKKGLSEGAALPLSVGLSAATGLAKELYDRRTGPAYRFSGRDLAADGVGILLAAGLILL